jgi:hypothetical protein
MLQVYRPEKQMFYPLWLGRNLILFSWQQLKFELAHGTSNFLSLT